MISAQICAFILIYSISKPFSFGTIAIYDCSATCSVLHIKQFDAFLTKRTQADKLL